MRADLVAAVAATLGTAVDSTAAMAGGDINDAFRVTLADSRIVFVKSHASPPAGFFSAEADGLSRLAATGAVPVPEVLAVSDGASAPAFLALSWVEHGPTASDHDERLGRALAALHRTPCETFGLDAANYLGTVVQDNAPTDSWSEFLAERRLRPWFRGAVDRGAIDPSAGVLLDRVITRLHELVGAPEPPSLLHGDVWGGNAITGSDGGPVLIDPAVFGGHREVDLAMMRLFGGFSRRVFDAYHEAFPLTDGHLDRVRLHQLPPLLVHAILFGGGYGSTVVDVLRSYA